MRAGRRPGTMSAMPVLGDFRDRHAPVPDRAALASGAYGSAAAPSGPGWELHELATGHWPVCSAPGDLARLLREIALGPAG